MNNLIIVLDANVIISAFLFKKGKPRQVLEIAKNNYLIILSDSIIQELREVLHRPKFDRYLALDIREDLLNTLIESSLIIQPDEVIIECRDPKDNKYLELAVSGNAHYIITGDDDLLVLNPFREIKIIKVDDFLLFNQF
jgi:uncharacterized protein